MVTKAEVKSRAGSIRSRGKDAQKIVTLTDRLMSFKVGEFEGKIVDKGATVLIATRESRIKSAKVKISGAESVGFETTADGLLTTIVLKENTPTRVVFVKTPGAVDTEVDFTHTK